MNDQTGAPRPTLEGLQALRALAALMVVVHHALEESLYAHAAPAAPDWVTTAGAAGVDLFFVISGFIMLTIAFPAAGAPDAPLRFLSKRIARIYPLYWLAAAAVLAAWSIGFYDSLALTGASIFRSLLLLPSDPLLVGVAWTLVHEVNFYVLFALTLFFRNPAVSLCGVAALLLFQALASSLLADAAARTFLSSPIVLEFCFGLALGLAYRAWRFSGAALQSLACLSFAALLAAPIFIAHGSTGGLDPSDRIWAWGAPALIIVAASLRWRLGASALGRFCVRLGDASYAIYLFHPFVMLAYAKALRSFGPLAEAPQLPLVALAAAASAALGLAVHVLIERRLTGAARSLLTPARSPAIQSG